MRWTRFNRTNLSNVVWIVVVVSIALAFVTSAAVSIEKIYLESHSFFFDPASYYALNIRVFETYNEVGLWPSVVQELFTNDRCPARTIPLLLFMPNGLADLWGHLWTELPVIFAFLFLLAWTVFSRTSSYYLALASIATFCSLRFLYDPKLGIAAYWLDTSAACSFGSAVICLLNYCRTEKSGWLFGFCLFASLMSLCRWSSAFYLLTFSVAAVPLSSWMTREALRRNGLRTAISLILLLPGIVFVFYFGERNFKFYETFGYALGASILESVSWVTKVVPQILGSPVVVFLLLLFGINFIRSAPGAAERSYYLLALCYPVSIFFFVCFVVTTASGFHPLTYFGPALLVAGFCTLNGTARYWNWFEATVVAVAFVLLFHTGGYVSAQKLKARAVHPHEKLKKECDIALSNLIVKTNARTFVQFDCESAGPKLETFFKSRIVCQGITRAFSVHEAYFKGYFGKETTPEDMAELSFKKVLNADLVAVFSQPTDALKPGVFNNRYSSTVAKIVSERVSKDPNFIFVSTVDAPSGQLSVYRNSRLAVSR